MTRINSGRAPDRVRTGVMPLGAPAETGRRPGRRNSPDREPSLAGLCATLFTGALESHADTLAFEDGPGFLDAAQLADPAVLADVLGRFAARRPGGDAKAAASFWSQHYFAALVIPVTVLFLEAGRALPLDIGPLGVRFCPDRGLPLRFRLAAGPPSRSGVALVRALFEAQVGPLVAALKRHVGLSTRLSWENAGRYGAWALGEVAHAGSPAAAAAARSLLEDDDWPRAGCAVMGHLKRAALDRHPAKRRLCCLRFRLPGIGRCPGTCPLAGSA